MIVHYLTLFLGGKEMKIYKQTMRLSLALLVAVGLLAGCSPKENGATATSSSDITESTAKTEEITVDITLRQEDKILEQKEIIANKEASLMEVIQANFDIKEDAGFITTIEGVEQKPDEGFFWTYTINDEMVNTGAKDTPLSDGDKVVFTYAKF